MNKRLDTIRIAEIGIVAAALVLLAATQLAAQSERPSTPQSTSQAVSSSGAASGPSDSAAQGGQTKPTAPPPAQTTPPEGFRLGKYEAHAEFEVGDRWSPGVKGNEQVYRSQVNLRQGARL